jgi:hypothetical protein
MAVFADTVELRLRIKDPLGAIAILSVADEDARLDIETPARQTAYKQFDTGEYWTYDADLAEWSALDLLLSDTRIDTLIDLYGVAAAAPKAIKQILPELGQKMVIARTQDGAGSTDYVNLTTLYNFYKDLIASMTEEVAQEAGESQGRMLRIRRPHIAGGMHF